MRQAGDAAPEAGGAEGTAPTDEALMAAYVGGERAAFDQLFARHAPALLGLIRRHVRGEEVARDLLQQTFLQLHRARHDFRADARLRPWLYTIAMNLVREHHRRRARRRETPLEPEHEGTLRVEGDPVEAAEETRRAERRVRTALASLPERQREVIELHWFQGRPFQEIAEVLGASLSAVKVRAHRGYERLRAALGAEEAP